MKDNIKKINDNHTTGKNIRDDRLPTVDFVESIGIAAKAKSSLANKEMFARVPLEGMPDPTGEVFRG